MTIREIKYINKQIHTLLHKIERLRACACNISPKISEAPGGAHVDDKIGKYVAEIEESEEKLRKLRAYRDKELSRLSLDIALELTEQLLEQPGLKRRIENNLKGEKQ